MNEKASAKISSLHLLRWYPNLDDPQLGIFVKKHIASISNFSSVQAIYVSPVASPVLKGFVVEKEVVNEDLEVTKVFYNSMNFGFAPLNALVNLWLYLVAFEKAYRSLKTKKFDLIHVHVPLRTAFIGWWLAKMKGTRIVITEHWTGYESGDFDNKPGFRKALFRFVFKRMDAIHVVSEALKKSMMSKGIGSENQYVVIGNVVEKKALAHTERKENEPFKIVTIADLSDKVKNVTGTLMALEVLFKKRQDFVFHLIGDAVPTKQLILDAAKEKSFFDAHFVYHGRLENSGVLEFLSGADMLVINSNFETFSVVCGEAIMSGVPVITTKCGGIRELGRCKFWNRYREKQSGPTR